MKKMEILIPIAVMILFDVAAWLWAFDSRPINLDRSDIPARSI